MQITLGSMLERLGIPNKPRFTIEEVAEILGIRRDQVLDLIKRQKLIGMKASTSRWSGVFAFDLASYIEAVNAPKTPLPSEDPKSSTQSPIGSSSTAFDLHPVPPDSMPASTMHLGSDHNAPIPSMGRRILNL